jgi:vacuolar-type H+-ATPase subunit F/Vma7
VNPATPKGGIVAIGGADLVLGLGLLGIESIAVHDATTALDALRGALERPDAALVLVDEAWLETLRDTLEAAAQDSTGPLVVEIPSATGAPAADELHGRVERALGFRLRE